jgi:magnesium chelatase subunit ChlI-like protein
MREFNLVGVAANISRVYEIAKAGNFTVRIVATEVVNQKDVDLFNTFYGFEPVECPDLIVELAYAPSDIFNCLFTSRTFETLEDINVRVAKHDFSNIEVKDTLNSACINLLKTATERLDLGVYDVIKIHAIAKTIAKLSECSCIKPEHVAEAILYRSVKQ